MSTRTVADLGERALVQRITTRLATPDWVVVGPGDDAAVVEPERGSLEVLTTDVQVEAVHFDHRFVPPDAIGHRSLACNLSDLAAMGARPRAALLSLVLPDALDVAVVDGMLDGVLALALVHRMAVVGGNIPRSPGHLMVDVTATGTVRRRRVLTRAGARPGDGVYVTGSVGDALVGLRSLQRGGADGVAQQEQRYLRPDPRVHAGLVLSGGRVASACMDLSDGLADAVRQIAEASQVGVTLDAGTLPISDAVRRWHEAEGADTVTAALQGGEDYELLFTVRPAHQRRLRSAQHMLRGVAVTRIGTVTRDRRLLLSTDGDERPLPEGFQHFR